MVARLADLSLYINLDRRQDRKRRMEEQCDRERISLYRLSAVDGRKLPPRLFPKTNGLGWPPGVVGCSLSHAMAIEIALASGCESLLVFEDDAVLPEGFAERFDELIELLPDDWMLVTFGGWHRYPPCPVWNGVSRLNYSLNSHAYMLRGEALTLARDAIHRRQSYVDSALAACQSLVPSYCADDLTVRQLGGFSDCWERTLDETDGRVVSTVRPDRNGHLP